MKRPSTIMVVSHGTAVSPIWETNHYCEKCFQDSLLVDGCIEGFSILRHQTWGTCHICKLDTKQKHKHKSKRKLKKIREKATWQKQIIRNKTKKKIRKLIR